MPKIYAVKNGHQTGLFKTWAECQEQVKGFSGAKFKSFLSEESARDYLESDEPINQKETKDNQPDIDHNDGQLHVYVDGSNKDGQYSWAFAVYQHGKEIHADYGVGEDADMASMNNVAGEISGASKAVEWAVETDQQIVIYHDFQGIASWVTREWRAKNRFTQAYGAFMREHLKHFTLVKVKGHVGVEGNERADELAKLALGIV